MTTSTTPISKEIEAYMETVCVEKDSALLKIYSSARMFAEPEMQISWLQSKFLQLLVQTSGATKILEIGTFVGFSAAAMARALPKGGELITCEIDEDHHRQAVRNFDEHGFSCITALQGDAKSLLSHQKISGQTFDLIFLDGDKEHYALYLQNLKSLLRTRGCFVADNTLFKGQVVTDPTSKYAAGINKFNLEIFNSVEFFVSQISIGDGMAVALKL